MARTRKRDQKLATPGMVGIRIRDLRERKGLSYDDVLEALRGVRRNDFTIKGISRSWLMKLEKGLMTDMRAYTVFERGDNGESIPRPAGLPAVIARIAYHFGGKPADYLVR